jgi:hypothetical protein
MKIYVAGSNEDKIFVKYAILCLFDKGYDVHDWTLPSIERNMKKKATDDFKAMLDCDWIIFINPELVSPGKYIEIGACRALEKRTIFIENKPRGLLANFGIFCKTIDDAIEVIEKNKI